MDDFKRLFDIPGGQGFSIFDQVLIGTVAFFMFLIEALVHHHMGKTGGVGISIPSFPVLVQIIAVMLVAAVFTSVVSNYLKKTIMRYNNITQRLD
jgi:hypothetical protein